MLKIIQSNLNQKLSCCMCAASLLRNAVVASNFKWLRLQIVQPVIEQINIVFMYSNDKIYFICIIHLYRIFLKSQFSFVRKKYAAFCLPCRKKNSICLSWTGLSWSCAGASCLGPICLVHDQLRTSLSQLKCFKTDLTSIWWFFHRIRSNKKTLSHS